MALRRMTRSRWFAIAISLVLLVPLLLVSCSQKQEEIKGTIARYGFLYSQKMSLGGPFKIRDAFFLELEEYPGKRFEMSVDQAEQLSLFHNLEESEKSGKVPFESKIYFETTSAQIMITIMCTRSGQNTYRVSSFNIEEPQ
jgi:hypothetical protein